VRNGNSVTPAIGSTDRTGAGAPAKRSGSPQSEDQSSSRSRRQSRRASSSERVGAATFLERAAQLEGPEAHAEPALVVEVVAGLRVEPSAALGDRLGELRLPARSDQEHRHRDRIGGGGPRGLERLGSRAGPAHAPGGRRLDPGLERSDQLADRIAAVVERLGARAARGTVLTFESAAAENGLWYQEEQRRLTDTSERGNEWHREIKEEAHETLLESATAEPVEVVAGRVRLLPGSRTVAPITGAQCVCYEVGPSWPVRR
jgi:hypothetical protein